MRRQRHAVTAVVWLAGFALGLLLVAMLIDEARHGSALSAIGLALLAIAVVGLLGNGAIGWLERQQRGAR
jgi:hypothetical protein